MIGVFCLLCLASFVIHSFVSLICVIANCVNFFYCKTVFHCRIYHNLLIHLVVVKHLSCLLHFWPLWIPLPKVFFYVYPGAPGSNFPRYLLRGMGLPDNRACITFTFSGEYKKVLQSGCTNLGSPLIPRKSHHCSTWFLTLGVV